MHLRKVVGMQVIEFLLHKDSMCGCSSCWALQVLYHMLIRVISKTASCTHWWKPCFVFAMPEVTLVQPFKNVDVGLLEDFITFKEAFMGDENLCFKRTNAGQVGVVSRAARTLISCQQQFMRKCRVLHRICPVSLRATADTYTVVCRARSFLSC